MPDGEESNPNEEILSAFRQRRTRAGDQAPGDEPAAPSPRHHAAQGTGAPPETSATGPTRPPTGTLAPDPDFLGGPDEPSVRLAEPVNPLAVNPRRGTDTGQWPGTAVAPSTGSPLAGPVALRPGAPLTAASPTLRLSDRLLADRNLTVQGSPLGRAIGIVVAGAGLTVAVLDRALYASRGSALRLGDGPSLLALSLGVAVLGALVWVAACFLPRGRRLTVHLAETQVQEWDRVQSEMRQLRGRLFAGAGLAVLGAALAILAFERLGSAGGVPAAAGILLLACGAGLAIWAQGRRSVLQRLYVQTLVLSSLERTGLGAATRDARVAPVLKALDQLLGALPESAVRAFLNSPEAAQYLELIDEASQEDRPQ